MNFLTDLGWRGPAFQRFAVTFPGARMITLEELNREHPPNRNQDPNPGPMTPRKIKPEKPSRRKSR